MYTQGTDLDISRITNPAEVYTQGTGLDISRITNSTEVYTQGTGSDISGTKIKWIEQKYQSREG